MYAKQLNTKKTKKNGFAGAGQVLAAQDRVAQEFQGRRRRRVRGRAGHRACGYFLCLFSGSFVLI